jgi:methanogenic corrinoid protein MtbC1
VSAPDLARLRDRYLYAQLAGDRRGALAVLEKEGFDLGVSVLDLQLRVIQEAQRQVGELWQEDRIGTAQEHMATAISHLALARLYQLAAPAAPTGKRVVLACVEGELHEFPARIAADALDLAGFDVKFLGASVPTDSLVKLVAAEQPDLLALSVTMSFHVPALRDAVARVRAMTGGKLPIAVGGHACAWAKDLAADVRADLTGADAAELVEGARRLLGAAT